MFISILIGSNDLGETVYRSFGDLER